MSLKSQNNPQNSVNRLTAQLNANPVVSGINGIRQNQIDLLKTLLSPGGYNKLPNYFGQLGSPTTGLQRQATDAFSQFLNQPDPQQRTMDTAMPMLQNIINGRPGQGVIDAYQPTFDRNLSAANQQGGRFSSGNEILRSRALQDYGTFAANAAQQGQQTQLQAVNAMSMLGQNAQQGQLAKLLGAYGIGSQDAGQQDLETQRRIQLIGTLLGGGQGVAFNQPQQQKSQFNWGGLLGTLLGSFGGPAGAAIGGAVGSGIGGGSGPNGGGASWQSGDGSLWNNG